MKTLSVIHSNTYFNELLRVARIQLKSSQFQPTFLFAVNYPTVSRDIGISLAAGISCLDGHGAPLVAPPPSGAAAPAKRSVISVLLRPLDWLRLRVVVDTVYYLLYLKKRISFIRQIVTKHNIKLIIIGGDLVHYDTAAIVKAGHLEKIPTVIVPCTMSNALEMAESYFFDQRYSADSFPNSLVAKRFPDWVYTHKGKRLLRLPAAHALAMILLRLSPPRPWINNSSFADRIAAESEAMIEYYMREEILAQQIVLTGSVSHDELYYHTVQANEDKARLYKKYQFDPAKPLIVSTLVVDQHYLQGGRPECEFPDYPALVEFWARSLGEMKYFNTVINLHPSVNREDFHFIEQWGAKLVDESLTALIPVCDLFVASVSSVIRWAIACSKPVINFDVYKFHYTDYLNTPGVITVDSKKNYSAMLHLLTSDPIKLEEVTLKQHLFAEKWGKLDGRASQRILDLFNLVVNESSS